MQFINSFQNSEIFSACLDTINSFPVTLQSFQNKNSFPSDFIQQNTLYHNLERNTSVSSPAFLHLLSPNMTSESEKSDTAPSSLCPLSKKISKGLKQADNKKHPKKTKHRRMTRELWKPHEDQLLLELVNIYGFKWTIVGRKIGGRTGKQVRDRYLNYLRPGIESHKNWTVAEDARLKELFLIHGNKWCLIAKHLPGRSECQVKNRFHSSIKEQLSSKDSSKEILIPINRTISLNEKILHNKGQMELIPSICKEDSIREDIPPFEESPASDNQGQWDGIDVFLNKFVEGDNNKQTALESEETFYFPNKVQESSYWEIGQPHFSFDFEQEPYFHGLL